MARVYFYVVDIGNSEWEVRAQDAAAMQPPARYPTADAAIEAATRFARSQWQASNTPTGVRVQTTLGGWREERNFGHIVQPGPEALTANTRRGS
jgi:hypothetical protein